MVFDHLLLKLSGFKRQSATDAEVVDLIPELFALQRGAHLLLCVLEALEGDGDATSFFAVAAFPGFYLDATVGIVAS